MSVLSDDTDVLLLIPPDFFLIPSDSEDELPKKSTSESLIVSDLISQVNDLEGRICLIESRCRSENMEASCSLQQSRQYGSVDALNNSQRSGFNSRSLQATPVKRKCGESPGKRTLEMRENILNTSDYMMQKDRDEQLLREIDQFFKERNNDDKIPLTKPEGVELTTAVFNLNKVNDLLKKLDDTQKEIEDKVRLKEITEIDDGVSEEKEQDTSCKRVLSFEEDKSGDFSEEQKKPSQELAGLLSLSNLWGSSVNMHKLDDEVSLRQRFQEEKCRRQHCEEFIQQLQLRLLEEQQKLAVAIKVDQEKDQAILKLTEGWNKLVGHWRDLESQRNNLAKKLLSDRDKFKTEMSSAYQTVKRYELELSKALDLAHGYKEKCEASERDRKSYRASSAKELDTLRSELKEMGEKLKVEESRREKAEKLLTAKEEGVNQGKAKISELQNQLRDGKKAMRELQVELESVKADRDKIGEKLREEKARAATGDQTRKALQQQNEELRKREKSLKDDLKLLTEQMEKVKVELKEFYQEQVENIVQEKLKEFQEQLATAEKTLQGEIEMREKTVTEMAVKQVQQIVEKHLMEINLLEEKHKEQVALWKLQVSQKEDKIKELGKKLEQYSCNKTLIAQKLHSIMEAQWQEALKIITSSSPQQVKSPANSARGDEEKSITRQNTFTMSSSVWGDSNKSSTISDTPFCQEGVLTFREEPKPEDPLTYRVDETPQKMSSDHLKKYIKALLERAPGHPTEDTLESTGYKCVDPLDESFLTQWQHVLSEPSSQLTSDISKYTVEGVRPCKEIKPPWK